MSAKRSIFIPAVLALWLAAMAYIGYDDYAAGRTPALTYFGTIAVTVAILVALHFNLRRREALRKKRNDDLRRNSGNK